MTPYEIFIFCQVAAGAGYSGDEADFNDSRFYNYFAGLAQYFEKQLKLNSRDAKKFISICAKQQGNLFNAYNLTSEECLKVVKDWQNVHGNENLYNKKIVDCFEYVFSFCMKKKIYSLKKYISEWGIQHLVGDNLTDNVAYALGVHKLTISSLDKMLINKKFLKNISIIKERIETNSKLKLLLQTQIKSVQGRLNTINPNVAP